MRAMPFCPQRPHASPRGVCRRFLRPHVGKRKKLASLAPAGLLLLIGLLAMPAIAQAARHALIIGNGAYPEDGLFAPFDYPRKDAEGMRQLIIRDPFGFNAPVVLLDANKRAMDSAFSDFLTRLNQGDSVLFYFSGHGVQVGGYNYLLPTGESFRNGAIQVKYNAVNANEWVDSIQRKIGVNGTQIAILDACRNDISKGADGGGLSEMGPGGALVAYAASPGKRALARGENGFSLYTGHLLEVWQEVPRMPVEQVFKQTRRQVAAATGNFQIPWTGGNILGDFCLHPPCMGFQPFPQPVLTQPSAGTRQQPPPPSRPAAARIGHGGRYIENGDGTVTDTVTQLQWMRCSLGQTWNGAGCSGEQKEMTWEEAKGKTARYAGHGDWRTPSIEELRTLVYCSNGQPRYFSHSEGNMSGSGCGGEPGAAPQTHPGSGGVFAAESEQLLGLVVLGKC